MIVLWILLGLLLFLFVLTLFPASVQIDAAPSHTVVRARYLFFLFPLIPLPEKKKGKPVKEKPPPTPKEDKKTGEKKKTSAQDILQLVKSSRNALHILRTHLVFSNMRVYISVGGEDAHKIALRTTHLRAFVALFLDILDSLFVLKKHKVAVLPSFTSEETNYAISLTVSIRPLFVLAAALSLLRPLMKFLFPQKARRKNKPQPTAPNH